MVKNNPPYRTPPSFPSISTIRCCHLPVAAHNHGINKNDLRLVQDCLHCYSNKDNNNDYDAQINLGLDNNVKHAFVQLQDAGYGHFCNFRGIIRSNSRLALSMPLPLMAELVMMEAEAVLPVCCALLLPMQVLNSP